MSCAARGKFVAEPERIGIFGGTFDPIHSAHIAIGHTALKEANLDRVLFVVSAYPPHKGSDVHASAEDRYAMVQAALAEEAQLEASRIELDREGPSYTFDTLRELSKQHPGSKLFFIIGQDSLIDLPKWRDTEGILSMVELLVLPRPNVALPHPGLLAGHYTLLPFMQWDISSTTLRGKIAAGEAVNAWLPEDVLRLIRDKGLYHVG